MTRRLLVCTLALSLTGCVRLDDIDWPGRRFAARLETMRTLDLRESVLAQRDPQPSARPPAATQPAFEAIPRPRATAPAAPDARPLTLDALRYRVLAENLGLRVTLLDPQIAATRIGEEEGRFDATVFGGARYNRQELPERDSEIVSFTSDNKDLDKQIVKLTSVEQTKERVGAELGLRMPLASGGRLEVAQTLDQDKKTSPRDFESYISGLKFSLSQPLLRGAGRAFNLAGLRIAAYRHQAVQARTKLATIRLLAIAEKAYWRVYAAQRVLDVRRQQYELANRNLQLVQRRVDEGLSPQIEVIRAEVGVAERLEALIVAETGLRVQQRGLSVLLNGSDAEMAAPPDLLAGTEPFLVPYELDRARLVETALRERMELLDLELRLAEDALRIDLARNQTLPLIMLDFEYGLLDRSGSLATAWSGMWDFDHSEFSIGLRGELQVTNQAARERLRRATLQRTQRLASQAQRRQAIIQEVHDTADLLTQNWQRILAARKNVAVAGVNYEAEQKQFAAGTRTMREVLEALAQLGDAQRREIRAIVEYQVAQIDLAFATGTLLGYARTELRMPRATEPPPPVETPPAGAAASRPAAADG